MTPRRNVLKYLSAAAILLIVVVGSQIVPPWIFQQSVAADVKQYRTAPGQRASITLPDGSTIVLAPQSFIRYAADFSRTSDRTVTLDGQALFTVTHSAGVPFVVNTAGVATKVLGTSFTVRRYASDSAIKVVVAQGRVSVGSAVLNSGDIAVATGSQDIIVSRDNAIGEQLAWAEGRLIFSNVPLRDVIPELERWYGIEVKVSDPALLNRTVITTLGPETASRAVELVAFAIEGRAEFVGPRAFIHSH